MIRAIIIEDEGFAVDRLKMVLSEVDPTVEVVEVIESIQEAVQWLALNRVDLIFLDINLADGSAFKIFEQVEIQTPIIFTTAYHEYALRAFEQCSIDYLLKPISREKLKNSLTKLRTLTKTASDATNNINLSELIDLMRHPPAPKRFMVNIGSKVKIIEETEVLYFVSDAKTIFLHTIGKKRYPLDSSLKQLQLSLPQNEFFRVNRQFLLSRKSISELQYFSPTHVKVILTQPSDQDIVVARDKIGSFKRWLAGHV